MSKQLEIMDHTGTTFDSFLEEENLLEAAEAAALKRVIAWQLTKAMKAKHVSKKRMAQQLRTSRSQVDRLLDPAYIGVSIATVAKAAFALGKLCRFDIVDSTPSRKRRIRKFAAADAGA